MAQENYILYYGGPKKDWNKTFEEKAEYVKKQTLLIPGMISKISIKVCQAKGAAALPKKDTMGNDANIDRNYTTKSWAVLTKGNAILVYDSGERMLKVLERFDEQWKGNIENGGFGESFAESLNLVAYK